jgi:GAF domain-containing protein/ANTAR domain-containing protein
VKSFSGDKESLFSGLGAICESVVRQTGADGAALAILTASPQMRELVYATDTVAQQLDELQYTLGEGPCLDAYLNDSPQTHPELTSVPPTSRWPTFAADAAQLGVHALFAFPIPDEQHPMGVLELYRRTASNLTKDEYAWASASAATIGGRLHSNWNDVVSHFGSTESAMDAMLDSLAGEADSPFSRRQIHVAGGMVAVQLGVDPNEAVDRLRAYSYASGRSISCVAADIIARRLTLHDQRDSQDD